MSDMESEGRLLSAEFDLSVPDPPRTVETVTLEIRTLQRQAQQILLGYAVEIGRRLEEVKAMLPHGQWGEYLKNEVEYSQSTANNFMRIYREYGAAQQSLFGGEAKSQAFANLTYTKALRLLALPNEEEREQFLAEHDVEHMSNRDLDKAMKEREAALEEAATAKAEAQAAKAAKKKADERRKAVEKHLVEAQKELDELRAKPIDVAFETLDPTPEQLAALTADAVEKARAADAERLQALEKQLAQSDPDTTAFRVLFDSWQEAYGKMMEALGRIRAVDSGKAEKLRGAVRAVIERME